MADTGSTSRLLPGMSAEKKIIVKTEHTASHLGSGKIAVYATPAMILHMEETALALVDPLLPKGMATVGASISVRHLAATPLGMNVVIRATLTAIDGTMLTFNLEAHDDKEKIGEGVHMRAIIDTARFAARLAAKAAS